ncbi:Aste57867_9882 [Aphanomyces stellatus]|uniref:Aste57867_9882 protein n=1 Tax=Aphanomyces stellatus TaxID=120398 RepID=A0A485KPL1_9STRA|nr:hypothetical protein As57867_009843 [Aphanomyces stellatus]VFT86761.1 Aste57867_9882 [Aphanomyces stellatus]
MRRTLLRGLSTNGTSNATKNDTSSIPTTAAPSLQTLGLSTSTIAVIAAGAVLFLVVIVVVVVVVRRRRTVHDKTATTSTDRHPLSSALSSLTHPSPSLAALDWRDLDLVRIDMAPLPLTHRLASSSLYVGTLRGEPVVIKSVSHPSHVQALIDEIHFMAHLQSSKVVSLVGAVWSSSRPATLQAIVEYMNLGSLADYLAATSRTAFPWSAKIACAVNVADALFAMHAQDTIHRDLNSATVLVDSVKGAKVAGFRASKRVVFGDCLTAKVGSLRWMAPEMLLLKEYSSAVDLFSFGVLLSELDTHQLPYADAMGSTGQPISDDGIARRVIYDHLRPSFRADCPDWFVSLAMQCMADDPTQRPTALQVMFTLKAKLAEGSFFV